MNTEILNSTRSYVNPVPRRLAVERILLRFLAALGCAAAVAVGANVAVPLPGTPVPMTLQTFCVILTGVALGPRWGAAGILLYLLLGTAGYHAFAGGKWGLMTLCGPTGGYLVGFLLAQPVLGRLTFPPNGSFARMLSALALGEAVIFACGLLWLHVWAGGDWSHTLALGLWPFVPGESVKIMTAALAGRYVVRAVRLRL